MTTAPSPTAPSPNPAASSITTTPHAVTSAVDAFLHSITAGAGIPADLYAPDAVLDATVPTWRLNRHGPAAIAGEYTGWFAHPAEFEELSRWPSPGELRPSRGPTRRQAYSHA